MAPLLTGLCRLLDVGDNGLKQFHMPRLDEITSQDIERKSALVINKDFRPSNAGLQQSPQSSLLPFQGRRAHVVLRECLRIRNVS